MTHNYSKLLNRSLLNKILLTLALVLGSSQAWAQYPIEIYNGGNDFPEGWTNSGFTITNSELVASGYTYKTLTSNNTITIGSGDKLVIKARRGTTGTSQYLTLSTSLDNSTYNDKVTFYYHSGSGKKKYEIYSTDDYVELISDNLEAGTFYLKFTSYQINIKSIHIYNDKELLISEDTPTAIISGDKTESVRVKYNPQSGWNTICVPFTLKLGSSYEHMTTLFGADWKAYKISSYADGKLTFANAMPFASSGLTANTPYLVYAPNAKSNGDGVLLNSNVTVSYSADPKATADGATFQGTYVTKTYSGDDWYGVTADGHIKKAAGTVAIKGYRAYFTGVSAEARVITIDDDGETTDLGFVKMVAPEAQGVYNLQGQRVEKGRKGIYIVNGKKVVIK